MKVDKLGFNSSRFALIFSVVSAITFQTESTFAVVNPDQPLINKASKIYRRLCGTKPNIDSAVFLERVELIRVNKLIEAAAKASDCPGFVTNTVRTLAGPFNSRDQAFRSNNLTPTIARFMGTIRDRLPFTEIFTAKYYYTADITGLTCNNNESPHACLERLNPPDFVARIVKMNTPQIPIYTNTVVDNGNNTNTRTPFGATLPNNDMDRCGIWVEEGFGTGCLEAGTLRRCLQNFYNQGFKLTNNQMRTSAFVSDRWVGKDVSRDPEATGFLTYQRECATCHAASFDGLRGAFAYLRAQTGNETNTNNQKIVIYTPTTINPNFNRNASNYPNGYNTIDNRWEIMFSEAQLAQLGWHGSSLQGAGVCQLAEQLTQFDQLYRGFVTSAAALVCPVDPNLTETGSNQLLGAQVKEELISQLKQHKDLRKTFESIVVRPECLGI